MQTSRLPKIWKLYLHFGVGWGGAQNCSKICWRTWFATTNNLLGFFTKQLTCCVPTYKVLLQKEVALPHNGQTKITSTEEHGTADISMQPWQFWYWCWRWWIDTPWRCICKLFEFHELAHLSCCEVGITDRCHWKSKNCIQKKRRERASIVS